MFDQKPACMHDVPMTCRCEKCGTVVGVSGPEHIDPNQIWRARSYPYGKVGIIEAKNGMVAWMQEEGPVEATEVSFRNDFWFWGMPEKTLLQAAFESAITPFLTELIEVCELEKTRPAQKEMRDKIEARFHSTLAAFERQYGIVPQKVGLVFKDGPPTVVIEWPTESTLKEVIRN